MQTNTKILIGVGVLALGVAVYLYYNIEPKVSIIINKDGSGTVNIGNKSADFAQGQAVELSYNGYTISAGSKKYLFRHFGSVLEGGDINQYSAGSSRVPIVNNFDYSSNN